MKLTPTFVAVTIFAGAASAFGLQSTPKSAIQNARAATHPFINKNKAMVQPIDVKGRPLDNSFVSIHTIYTIGLFDHRK